MVIPIQKGGSTNTTVWLNQHSKVVLSTQHGGFINTTWWFYEHNKMVLPTLVCQPPPMEVGTAQEEIPCFDLMFIALGVGWLFRLL